MGDVVNLRQARKRKARAGREKAAQENRTVHGRSRAERDAEAKMRERERLAHEAHRRDTGPDEA